MEVSEEEQQNIQTKDKSPDMSCEDSIWRQGDFVPTIIPSNPTSLNTSVWSEVNSTIGESVNFRKQSFQLTGHFSSIPTAHRGEVLLHPHDIAYLPFLKQFLVTETFYDRIGVYDENFDFKYWLPHPKRYMRFSRPTSVLSLRNGFIFIVERKGIQIFDAQLNYIQFKDGHCSGLTEDNNEAVYTLAWIREENCRCHVRRLSLTDHGKYTWRGTQKLSLMSEDVKAAEANPRFLSCHNDTIIITDIGLNRYDYFIYFHFVKTL